MLTDANLHPGDLPLNPIAREVAAVCDKHAIAHGSPGRLADFMRALHRNKHLAMDFWALVVRISSEEHSGSVDPNWLLGVIVEGVTGRNLDSLYAAGTPEVSQVGELASMLAGEDVPTPPTTTEPLPLALREVPPLVPPEPIPLAARQATHRLVLEPEAPTPLAALHPHSQEMPLAFSMAGYAEENSDAAAKYRAIIAGLAVIFLLAGGLLLLRHGAPALWTHLRSAAQARVSSQATSRNTIPSAPAASRPHTAAASPFAVPQPGIPIEDTSAAPAPDAHTQIPQPLAPPSNTSHGASPPVSTLHGPADIPSVFVPEQSMQSNLISSRVPIYPLDAGTPGPVVIRAIVTAEGTVRPIEVISGDPTLRHAALDAVAAWRYRPWLIDGTPTDVTTTITVDPPNSAGTP